MKEERYRVPEEEELLTPSLIYYGEMIENNISQMIKTAGKADRLWPHVKTYKTEEIVKMQIQWGIKKFKAATIAEAEMAARAGAEVVLLAYPLVGPNIERFYRLQQEYYRTDFWAVGDDLEQLRKLGNIYEKNSKTVSVLVDINIGGNRTGVELENLELFYHKAAEICGLSIKGVHCYDGVFGMKNYRERETAVQKENCDVLKTAGKLREEGYDCGVLVMGGTPTFLCHVKTEGIYVSPGTSVVYDWGYAVHYPEEPFMPAAAIATRVISHGAEGYFTLDLGYKGIAADPPGEKGILLGIPYAKAVYQNEEHWVWKMKEGYEKKRPEIGKVLYIIPAHICPTTALYDKILLLWRETCKKEWIEVTARNRKLSI